MPPSHLISQEQYLFVSTKDLTSGKLPVQHLESIKDGSYKYDKVLNELLENKKGLQPTEKSFHETLNILGNLHIVTFRRLEVSDMHRHYH